MRYEQRFFQFSIAGLANGVHVVEVFYGPRSLVFLESDNRKWTIMAMFEYVPPVFPMNTCADLGGQNSLLFGKWSSLARDEKEVKADQA